MANKDYPNGFKWVKGPLIRNHYQVNTSQGIKKGDMVVLSSGKVSLAASNSGALLGVADAAKTTGGSVTAADTIEVICGAEGTVFQGQCSGNSAVALIGTDVDIEGTTGIMEVDENATTEQVIRVVEIPDTTDLGVNALGANGRVNFIIKRSQFNGYVAAL
jgi:hypothetical protein